MNGSVLLSTEAELYVQALQAFDIKEIGSARYRSSIMSEGPNNRKLPKTGENYRKLAETTKNYRKPLSRRRVRVRLGQRC